MYCFYLIFYSFIMGIVLHNKLIQILKQLYSITNQVDFLFIYFLILLYLI